MIGCCQFSWKSNTAIRIKFTDYWKCIFSSQDYLANAASFIWSCLSICYCVNVFRKLKAKIVRTAKFKKSMSSIRSCSVTNGTVTVNGSSPKIPIAFKADNFCRFSFVWNNSIFFKGQGKRLTTYAQFKSRLANISFVGMRLNFSNRMRGAEKISKCLDVFSVLSRKCKSYLMAFISNIYVSISHHNTNPISCFRRYDFKSRLIDRISSITICRLSSRNFIPNKRVGNVSGIESEVFCDYSGILASKVSFNNLLFDRISNNMPF